MSQRLLSRFVSSSLPYSQETLANVRLMILDEMKTKGFQSYVIQMKEITNRITSMNHQDMLNDDYWDDILRTPYWLKQSPNLGDIFNRGKIRRFGLTNPTGIGTLTSVLIKEKVVENIVGDPAWMNAQQKILFKTLLATYFKNDIRLWPIYMNMDFVFSKKMMMDIKITDRALTTTEIETLVNKWEPPSFMPVSFDVDEWTKGIQEMRERYRQQLLDYNNATPEERKQQNLMLHILKSALSGAGPLVLKILQQVNTANENKIEGGASVAELTQDIFSSIPGLTEVESRFVFQEMAKTIDKEWIRNMDRKMLGSASIAEAHATKNQTLGIPGIIKFIKPMYGYYFLCEIDFILTTFWKSLRYFVGKEIEKHKHLFDSQDAIDRQRNIWLLQTRELILYFLGAFTNEFNYYLEFKNTTIGYEIYNKPKQGVRSIVVLQMAQNPFPVLVLQKVNGPNLDKILNNPSTEKMVAANLYRKIMKLIALWFKNALWGNGFFHADLHPGNVMLDEQTGELFLIDFGSCGVLSPPQQCTLIDMIYMSGEFHQMPTFDINTATDTEIKKHEENILLVREFTEKAWQLCDVHNYTLNERDFVASKMLDYKKEPSFTSMFIAVIMYSSDIGACLSNDLTVFGRGVVYLLALLEKVTRRCGDNTLCPSIPISNVVAPILIRHPIQLYRLLQKDWDPIGKRYLHRSSCLRKLQSVTGL